MIQLEDAILRILQQIPRLGLERVNLLQAQGRVLGEDIIAPWNIPPWDNSAMDGYALRWKDVQEASSDNPAPLQVLFDCLPGGFIKGALGKAGL